MPYKVTLRKGFPGERRSRAGIYVTRADGYEGELNKDQLEAIKADPELTLSEVKPEPAKADAPQQDTRKMVDEQPKTKKK